VRLFGVGAAYVLLVPVSLFFLLTDRRARRASAEYLARRFPGAGRARLLWYGWRHFYGFGRLLVDRFAAYAGRASAIEPLGEEDLLRAMQTGQGVLLLSFHTGNWELASQLFSRYPTRLNVVMFENEGGELREFMERVRAEKTFRVIAMDDSGWAGVEALRALREGETVAMLADRTFDDNVLTLPVLGRPARFPKGPFQLAAAAGSPVFVCTLLRQPGGRYRFRACPPFVVEKGEQGIRQAMERYVRILEQAVSERPFQWGNLFPFWA
jgi:predicted LPLAT superfamily acyltransferase